MGRSREFTWYNDAYLRAEVEQLFRKYQGFRVSSRRDPRQWQHLGDNAWRKRIITPGPPTEADAKQRIESISS